MRISVISALLLLLALPVNAHHATATNFTQERISAEGAIQQVRYQNPHASILIKSTAEDGSEIYWLIETLARTTLQRRGVTLDRLKVGTHIKATGLKGRRQYTMYLLEIEFEDGSKFTTKGVEE